MENSFGGNINDFLIDKCINTAPSRPKDLNKFYNEYMSMNESKMNLKSYSRSAQRVFEIWNKIRILKMQNILKLYGIKI